MALIASLAVLFCTGVFCFLMAAFGQRVLRWGRVDLENDAERILVSVAVGVIAFEAALAIVEPLGNLKPSVVAVILAIAVVGISEYRSLLRSAAALLHSSIMTGSRGERFLLAILALVLFFEGLGAMAPLTGSDALHYHFASPLLVLRNGFHPDFFLSHSFLTGQGHLLILAALAAGTDKLALAMLYLGGVLAAAATACVAQKWVAGQWVWLSALAFLLSPVVFWQITSAGSPDIWMSFFMAMAVLVIARARSNSQAAIAAIAGLLAGAVAGTKYTGCIVAASLLAAFFWETRSLRRVAIFCAGALAAGVWPYLRNFVWTGDPFFPFALRWFSAERVNNCALTWLLADTGTSGHTSIWQLAKFPLLASIDPAHLGFWQFFGPLCLIFAPLVVLAVRNTPLWRTAILVWLTSSTFIGASSGMTRFLMPVLPVALSAAIAGAAALFKIEWRIAGRISAASIAMFLLLGAGGFAMYARPALAAAVGLTNQEDYLRQRSPDYAVSEFLNQTLAAKESEGNALVFFRHVYHLRIPFLYGDPKASWSVDPARLSTPEAWREFFWKNRIRWVVRSPEYPEEIAAPLVQLEQSGALTPVAHQDVATFEGMRILGIRKTVTAVIFQVND
jgi:hypothetical protein